jgi:hypothetical protein
MRNLTIYKGVVKNPETAPAPAEKRMPSAKVGALFSVISDDFSF